MVKIRITPKFGESISQFVGESKKDYLKGNVWHSIEVPESEAKIFTTIEEANQWLEVLVTDKSSDYEIVPANV